MRYDNGKEIPEFTSIDNAVLEKITRIQDLSKLEKDVLLSLCRQIFRQYDGNIIQTSWWGAADVTADALGCSERSVRRAYEELEKRNIISKRLRLREADINGNPVPRKCNWITINTDTKTWIVKERTRNKPARSRDKNCRPVTKILVA